MTNHPLAHKTVNSAAQLKAMIRSRERQHWFAGLRQAELEADKLNEFLARCPWWKRWFWRAFRQQKPLALVRDAECQLALVLAERTRIIEQHPEATKGYEELQATVAEEARLVQNAYFLAAQQLSVSLNLPSAATELLLSLEPGERGQVMLQSRVLTQGVERQLLPLPPEQLQSLQTELAQFHLLQAGITSLPPTPHTSSPSNP